MRAAIYARYSSENQRPESIEDQIGSCRGFAGERGFAVLEDHIYTDVAASGARLMAGVASDHFAVQMAAEPESGDLETANRG